MIDQDQVKRLGFDAWADNIIANVIEDLNGAKPFDQDIENEDLTVLVRVIDRELTATVRAYIPGSGWHYHDRVIKLKGGAANA